MTAAVWAISFTGAKRSRRAINESCRVAGMASGGRGAPSRYSPASSTKIPASITALVSSSTNNGFPSVLARICFITSEGSARPLVTCATMASTWLLSRRRSVIGLTLGRPPQGGSNSGRNVNRARTDSWRSRSTAVEQLDGGGIRPVGVLEQDHDRSPAREGLELIEQCGECSAALLCRAERQRRIAVAGRDRQQRGKKWYHLLPPRWVDLEERLDFVEALFGRIVGLEPCRSLQLRDDWTKRAVAVVGRTLIVQANGTLAGDAFSESRS